MPLRYRALLIANWEYQHMPVLRGPKNDLAAMQTALKNENYGLFTESDSIEAHENLPSLELGETIQMFLASAGREDYLLLYFSGHGGLTSNNYLALCGVNSKSDFIDSSAIDTSNLPLWIQQKTVDCPAVMVLDCCFAGQVGATKGQGSALLKVTDRNIPEGLLVLASSGRSPSLDAQSENVPSPFTEKLAKILVDPQIPGDDAGILSGLKVYDLLDRGTRGEEVRPVWKGGGKGSFFLAKRPRLLLSQDLPGWPRQEIEAEVVDINFTTDEIKGPWSEPSRPIALGRFDPTLRWAIRRLIHLSDEVIRQPGADKESLDAVRNAWHCIGDSLFGAALPAPLQDMLRREPAPPGGLLKLRLSFGDGAFEDYPWEFLSDPEAEPQDGRELDVQHLPLGRRPGLLLERAAPPLRTSTVTKIYKALVINTYQKDLVRTGQRVRDDLFSLYEEKKEVDYIQVPDASWPRFCDDLEGGSKYLVLISPLRRMRDQAADPKTVRIGFANAAESAPEWHTAKELLTKLSEISAVFDCIVLVTYAYDPGHDSYRAALTLASQLARSGRGPVAFVCHERAYQEYLENQPVAKTFAGLLIRALEKGKPLDRAFVWARNRVIQQAGEEAALTFGIPGLYAPQLEVPARAPTSGMAASSPSSSPSSSPTSSATPSPPSKRSRS